MTDIGGQCARRWEFSQDGNVGDWKFYNDITVPVVAAGYHTSSSTTDDPRIRTLSSLNIDADNYKMLEARMKCTAGNMGQLFFRSPSDTAYTGTKSLTFPVPNNTTFVTYRLDLRGVASWKGIIDQLRFDPVNASGASIEIDYIRVCYPLGMEKPVWEFNADGNKEGWTANPHLTNISVVGGLLSGEVSSTNPTFISPGTLTVDSAKQNAIRMRARLSAGDRLRVFYRKQGETTYAGYKDALVPSNQSFVHYWVDLSRDADYTGTIEQFRLAPLGAPVGAKLEVDNFRVVQPAYGFAWRWDFDTDGDLNGWTALKHLSAPVAANGFLTTTTTGDDSNLVSRSELNIDAATRQWVVIRMKVSAGTFAELFYKAPKEIFSAAKKKRFDLLNNTDFVTYTLDMSGESNWTGTIDHLRIDPTTAVGATVEIDYVLVP